MANEQDTMDEWAAAMAEAEGGARSVELEELQDDKAASVDKRKLNNCA